MNGPARDREQPSAARLIDRLSALAGKVRQGLGGCGFDEPGDGPWSQATLALEAVAHGYSGLTHAVGDGNGVLVLGLTSEGEAIELLRVEGQVPPQKLGRVELPWRELSASMKGLRFDHHPVRDVSLSPYGLCAATLQGAVAFDLSGGVRRYDSAVGLPDDVVQSCVMVESAVIVAVGKGPGWTREAGGEGTTLMRIDVSGEITIFASSQRSEHRSSLDDTVLDYRVRALRLDPDTETVLAVIDHGPTPNGDHNFLPLAGIWSLDPSTGALRQLQDLWFYSPWVE